MTLIPTPTERLARARTDLRLGLPVLLDGGAGQQALVLAAEGVDPERLAAVRGLGPAILAITSKRAETLRARPYDGDLARLVMPPEADATWVSAVADPQSDMSTPMKGPFQALRVGDPDLHRTAIRLAKAAHLLPAAVVVQIDAAAPADITSLDSEESKRLLDLPVPHRNVVSGRVPLSVSEAGRVHVFRSADGSEEHFVCEIGRPPRDRPVLTRLHSACFTGDVLGSLKCDCGPQLHTALAEMGKAGAGILIYLNQEGRGIGLANKMRAYALQDQGFDTVEANHRLGFEDDERDFRTGADILKRLGFFSVRLMTNNPAKVEMMEANGISVQERVPLHVGLNPLNAKYLDIKAKKSGHIL